MKFNRADAKVHCLVKISPLQWYRLRTAMLGRCCVQKHCGPCVQGAECEPAPALASEKARNLLGCIRDMASIQREGITPFWVVLLRAYCIQFGALQYKRCKMGVSSARGHWNSWGYEHFPSEERLRDGDPLLREEMHVGLPNSSPRGPRERLSRRWSQDLTL